MTDTRQGQQERSTVTDENMPWGFVALPRLVLRAQGLSGGAKLTYASIADYCWTTGTCFAGQERLAGDLGLSTPTLSKYLHELEAWGLVHRTRRGLGRPDEYRLTLLIANPRFAERLAQLGLEPASLTPPAVAGAEGGLKPRPKNSSCQDTKELGANRNILIEHSAGGDGRVPSSVAESLSGPSPPAGAKKFAPAFTSEHALANQDIQTPISDESMHLEVPPPAIPAVKEQHVSPSPPVAKPANDTWRAFAAFCRDQNLDPNTVPESQRSRELRHAKEILAAGHSLETILACANYLRGLSWYKTRDAPVGLGDVAQRIAAYAGGWRAKEKPPYRGYVPPMDDELADYDKYDKVPHEIFIVPPFTPKPFVPKERK